MEQKNYLNEIKSKTKSIIYISGLGVYGETRETIVDENQKYNPNTDFVKIRLDAEKYLKDNSDTKQNRFCSSPFWRCLWARWMVLRYAW